MGVLADDVQGLADPRPIALGLIDGDALADVVYAFEPHGDQTNAGVGVLFNDGGFTSSVTATYGSAVPAQNLLVQDLTGDGLPEVIVLTNASDSGETQSLYIFGNRGTGPNWLAPYQQIDLNLSSAIVDLEAGDFNGDGLIDLVAIGNSVASRVLINKTTVDSSVTLTFSAGETLTQDFTNAEVRTSEEGGVNGTVYDDLNGNGMHDAGDLGLSGATVYADLNNNGRFDEDSDVATTTVDGGAYALSHLPDGTFSIRLETISGRQLTGPIGWSHEIEVQDGVVQGPSGTFDFFTKLNAAPEITDLVTTPAAEGEEFSLSARFVDADSPATWHRAVVDWGDGKVSEALVTQGDNGGSLAASHRYAEGGFYDATLTVIDGADETVFSSRRFLATVSGVGVHDGVLEIVGTDSDDRVTVIQRGKGQIRVKASFLPETKVFRRSQLREIDAVELSLFDGDDSVIIVGTHRALAKRPEALILQTGGGNDFVSLTGASLSAGFTELSGGLHDDTYQIATRNSQLRITDREGNNTLDFSRARAGVHVDLVLNRGETQQIGGGNNTLTLTGSITDLVGSRYADHLFGDAQNNTIRGLAGTDIILGRDGDDRLFAGVDRSLLIGGGGFDTLVGATSTRPSKRAGSVLIGGRTTYDDDIQALDAIMAEWASHRPLDQRMANLIDGTGSKHRKNDGYFLDANSVFDDEQEDVLLGDSRMDWFLAFPGDEVIDKRPGKD
jgi:hypothetical protein